MTAFALALLTDRVLFVDDAVGKFYGIFSPTFDCNYTQSRRGTRDRAACSLIWMAWVTHGVNAAGCSRCRIQTLGPSHKLDLHSYAEQQCTLPHALVF